MVSITVEGAGGVTTPVTNEVLKTILRLFLATKIKINHTHYQCKYHHDDYLSQRVV